MKAPDSCIHCVVNDAAANLAESYVTNSCSVWAQSSFYFTLTLKSSQLKIQTSSVCVHVTYVKHSNEVKSVFSPKFNVRTNSNVKQVYCVGLSVALMQAAATCITMAWTAF